MQKKIFSWALILLPILMQYSIGIKGITLGEICIIGAMILTFISTSKKIILTKEKKIFIMVFLSIYFVSGISFIYQGGVSSVVISRIIRYTVYFLIIIFCSDDFDFAYIYKSYKSICMAIAIYMIFQKVFFEVFTVVLPNKILPLNWYANVPGIEEVKKNYIDYFFQARGIFTEQGYVIHYFLPCLVFLVYDERKKIKNWIQIGIMLIALWFTKSVQAYVLGGFVVGGYLLRGIWSREERKLKKSLLFLFPIIISGILILQTPSGKIILEKVTKSLFSGGSVSLRLGRGYAIYAILPNLLKFFGVGMGNLDMYVLNNSIRTRFDPIVITENSAGYVNGMSSIFLYGGILGGILFLLLLYNRFMKGDGITRLLVLAYTVLLLGEGVVFSTIGIFFLIFIFQDFDCIINSREKKHSVRRRKKEVEYDG